jgi:hypothetical protein
MPECRAVWTGHLDRGMFANGCSAVGSVVLLVTTAGFLRAVGAKQTVHSPYIGIVGPP